MTLFSKIILAGVVSASVITTAHMVQSNAQAEGKQVDVYAAQYAVKQSVRFCSESCPAVVAGDGFEIFIEYGLDGESVRYMEPLSISRDGVDVGNAYIDRSEISKINAAIVAASIANKAQ